MDNMDKLCLNLNRRDADIRDYFRKLREDQNLFDVTLATNDGQHIQAHKMILSEGSYIFSDIFMKNSQSNMFVYLKGISSANLQPIIDFIYNGEVFITQSELNEFIETGKDLRVKGIEFELTETPEIIPEKPLNPTESEHCDIKDEIPDTADHNKDCAAKGDEGNIQPISNNELTLQINEMIEKDGDVWICKICGKKTTHSSIIRKHAEKHIEGMSYACHTCDKTFSTRHYLICPISGIHSELFSCDICGKTGMNRVTYRQHKRRKHYQNNSSDKF